MLINQTQEAAAIIRIFFLIIGQLSYLHLTVILINR